MMGLYCFRGGRIYIACVQALVYKIEDLGLIFFGDFEELISEFIFIGRGYLSDPGDFGNRLNRFLRCGNRNLDYKTTGQRNKFTRLKTYPALA